MKLIGGIRTDIGSSRDNNQDSVLFCSKEVAGHNFAVLVVCDGVGGLEKGDVASNMITRKISQWYEDVINWVDIPNVEPGLLFSHMKDAAEIWNDELVEYNKCNGICSGTTMSLLMIIRDYYYIIQVGDSRIYSYDNDVLEQLTIDATVSKMNNGRLRQYLDNFMGKTNPLWFTTVSGQVKEGDLFIACSDGGYHFLISNDIAGVCNSLNNENELDASCGKLINDMMSRGEKDNISIGMIAIKKKRKGFKPFGKRT